MTGAVSKVAGTVWHKVTHGVICVTPRWRCHQDYYRWSICKWHYGIIFMSWATWTLSEHPMDISMKYWLLVRNHQFPANHFPVVLLNPTPYVKLPCNPADIRLLNQPPTLLQFPYHSSTVHGQLKATILMSSIGLREKLQFPLTQVAHVIEKMIDLVRSSCKFSKLWSALLNDMNHLRMIFMTVHMISCSLSKLLLKDSRDLMAWTNSHCSI